MTERRTGIYMIRNAITGDPHDCYIGQSINIDCRWAEHRRGLRHGYSRSRYLQRAWNKYREGAFEFSVLACCEPEELTCLEQYFTDLLGPNYSVCRECVVSTRGTKMPEHMRAVLSAVHRGNKYALGKHWKLGPEALASKSSGQRARYSRLEEHARSSAAQLLRYQRQRLAGISKIPWNKGLKTGPNLKLSMTRTGMRVAPWSAARRAKYEGTMVARRLRKTLEGERNAQE